MFFKLRYTEILLKKRIYLLLAMLQKHHVEFELVPPVVEARSLNHWTVREFPRNS